MFFVGKMKKTKTEERKTRRSFGMKEMSGPFPLEACSNNMVSLEKKASALTSGFVFLHACPRKIK